MRDRAQQLDAISQARLAVGAVDTPRATPDDVRHLVHSLDRALGCTPKSTAVGATATTSIGSNTQGGGPVKASDRVPSREDFQAQVAALAATGRPTPPLAPAPVSDHAVRGKQTWGDDWLDARVATARHLADEMRELEAEARTAGLPMDREALGAMLAATDKVLERMNDRLRGTTPSASPARRP